jgi:hypothetical protein
MNFEPIALNQEIYRARAIIEKAERFGENVGKSLRDHMVSQSIILELTGEIHEYTPKAKRSSNEEIVLDWARDNVGVDTNPTAIAEATGLSYSTCNKIVQLRMDWFQKIRKGHYIVHNANEERAADKRKELI